MRERKVGGHRITRRKTGRFFRNLLLVLLFLLAARFIAQKVIYHLAVNNHEISEMQILDLAGREQKVLLEGKQKNAPILILFHGGPQSPFIYGNAYRNGLSKLSDAFILVHWDMPGCGQNFTKDVKEITFEDQKNMACDLVEEMKAQFPGRSIYLFGYSNGTLISMEVYERLKTDIAGIMNLGPITSIGDARELAYQALKEEDLSERNQEKLEKLYEEAETDYGAFAEMEGMLLSKTKRILYDKNPFHYMELVKSGLLMAVSPDYSFADIYHACYNVFHDDAYDTLKSGLQKLDEKETMNQIQIPLLILQSEGDIYGSMEYFSTLEQNNSNVQYERIPKCGHLPTDTGYAQIYESMVEFMQKTERK